MPRPDPSTAAEPKSLATLAAQQPREPRRRKAAGVAFSLLAHGAVLLAILFLHRDAPMVQTGDDGPMMMASLVDGLQQSPAPAASAPAQTKHEKVVEPPKQKSMVRKARVTRDEDTLDADEEEPIPVLTASQLASASTAESGGGAGGSGEGAAGGGGKHCNMAQLLQAALRRDAHVQSAIAASPGPRAMFVWNGDWVRSSGQDGKGLAALREAILWEVGFAPEICRKTPIHGLVTISLHDGPGAPRIVLGHGAWRWQDILGVRE